jgi:hypothetical protein
VSIAYLVSAFPSAERERVDSLRTQAGKMFPHAHVINVFCPGLAAVSEVEESAGQTDHTASSLVQAMQLCTTSPRRPAAYAHSGIPA